MTAWRLPLFVRSSFALLTVIGLGLVGLAAPAAAQNRLSISPSALDAPGGTVLTGDLFRYRVSYSCDLISIPSCDGVVVTVDLPPELVFSSFFFPPSDVASASHDGSPMGGTVTFNFNPAIPAGNTGDVEVTVFFPNGSTADGTPTTLTVAAAASSGTGLAPQVADLPVITASATAQPVASSNVVGGFLGDCPSASTYEITLEPSSASGSLNFLDGEVVLTLPTGVTNVTPLDGGVYEPIGNTVTWSGLGPIPLGSFVTVRVDVSFEDPPFSGGDTVTASASGTVDPLGEPPGFAFGPIDFTDTIVAFIEDPDVAVSKSFGQGRQSGLPPAEGQDFTYQVGVVNTGNHPLDTLVVVDDGDGAGADIDAGIDIRSVSTGAYSSPPTSVTLTVTGDMGSTPSVTSPDGATNTTLDLTGGALLPGERAIRIEWVFNGGSPVGMSPTSAAIIAATANVGFPEGTTIDNHVEADWTATLTGLCGGPAGPASGGAADSLALTVNGAYSYLNPHKNEVSSGPYFPGDTVSFSLDIINGVLANDPATGVVVTDLLPEFLAFQSGTEAFVGGGTGVGLGLFEEIPNYGGTGRTLLRWTLTGDLDPGETVMITFDTTVQLGVIFSTLTNSIGMTYPAGPVVQECAGSSATDVADLDGDGDTTDTLCTANEGVIIAAVAQLASVKLVQGQCNNSGPGFIPGLATDDSVPSGIVDWRIQVQNVQTVPMEDFVVIDILPFVGDTGVRNTSPRASLFRTFLSEPIAPPPGGTVFYSLSGNPCRGEVGGPTTGCDPPNWTSIPPTPISAAQSFKVEFGDRVLNPLDVLQFDWRMVLPADAPTDGSEAFNSFAFGSRRQDDGGFLAAEPNKVGIDASCAPVPPDDATLGDFVWVDTSGNGIQDPGEGGVNDVPVELFSPGPDGLPRTGDDVLVLSTLTADDALGNPGWYQFSVLSAGDFYVQFTPPPNFEVTLQGEGGNPALDSDADPITACTDVVTLGPSENNPNIDMGLLPPATASLGNYVWFDRNNNGIQDEALTDGANGVAVKLFVDDGDGIPEPGGDDGTPLQVTVTADDGFGNPGFYAFENLVPGTPYFVQIMLPPTATVFTARNAGGDDTVDSDANPSNGTTPVVILAAGEDNRTLDAGLRALAGTLSLGNVVWCDDDGNGVIDAPTDNDGLFDPLVPEAAVNGVRLNLYLDDNSDGLPQVSEYFGATLTQTIAGKDGRYRFDNLAAGEYIVEVPSSNFASGGPLEGKITATGNEPTSDPDDDADNDDEGDTVAASVVSQAITLSVDGEPTPDADDDLEDDDNINFTLDFGFIPGAPQDFDLGDAPDAGAGTAQGNYQTVTFDGGAIHELTGPMGPYLGACVDSDSGTQQSFNANADDLGGALTVTHGACATAGDDEDGVTFSSSVLVMGGTFDLTVSSSSATACLVGGWIDWNRDGSFDDFAPEKILTDAAPGAFPAIPVPPTAVPGFTYARFRCSTAGGDAPVGPSPDGEVEDYLLQVTGADWGDAPDVPYTTLLATGGPAHATNPTVPLYLGSCVDTESDGQPTAGADGDDVNLGSSRIGDCLDDEDGVIFNTMLVRGQMATLTVTSSMDSRLDGWIDLNGLGGFAGADQIIVNQPVTAGANVFNFLVPINAVVGITYARFRLSTAGGLAPGGMAADGEVEDYAVVIKGFDFGDAPDLEYPTVLASGGAQHVVDPTSSVYLGACADAEDDGQSTANADGDDLGVALSPTSSAGTCGGPDDENGVVFNTMVFTCQTSQITVTAGAAGRLDAWIDYDRLAANGFGGGSDQIFANRALTAGANVLTFNVPCGAQLGDTFARFRFSSAGGLTPGGFAMNGEVEDYPVLVKGVDFGDAADSHSTSFAAGGPTHGVDPAAPLFLGACIDTETDAQAPLNTTGDDANGGTSTAGVCAAAGDDEDGVAFTSMIVACDTATVDVIASGGARLDGWLDFTGDGTFAQAGERIFTSQAVAAGVNSLSFSVPCTAIPGTTAVRFRLSSGGVASFNGQSMDGEVEDYQVSVKGVDFGDAPNTYPTLFASGGPYHGVDPAAGLFLGSCVDTEANGQVVSGNGMDDDANVGSSTTGTCVGGDEDGVVFNGLITACKSGDVTVTASAAGRLDAWIDFGGDGSFAQAGDQIFASEPLAAGANSLSFTVPCSASAGNTFTRFRFSSAGGLAPGGRSMDGEVEDYQIGADEADFGDAPDTYGTLFASGGALHGLDPAAGLYLGACVDGEADGQPTLPATGDDLGVGTSRLGTCAGNDDEDGVSFDTMVAVCQQADLTVTASAAGRLDAWLDLDGDGTFAGPNDQIFAGQALVAGANSISFPVPCGATPGSTYARFRFSSGGGLGATGTTPNGEVEDYALVVKGSDFGDAPNPEYPTILANGGAQHVVDPASSVYLGVCADPEADGQPSANADGDDLGAAFGTTGTAGTCAGNDDENGVTFDTMLFACQTSQITVVAGAAGRLDAWIDFDRTAANGFGGASDQIFTSQALVAGANILTFDVPCNAQLGDTYARFRFSTAGGLAPGGVAMDGEVEDYPILVKGVDFGDAADTHSTTFASGGPTHGVDPASPLYLGACVDTELDAQAPLDTTGDDAGSGISTVGTCAVAGDDEDGVTFTSMVAGCETATIDVIASGAAVLDAWLDFTGDGTFAQAGERIFTGQALAAGANSLSFSVPCDADPGTAAVRFRLSSGGVASFNGQSMDGEVEDYETLVKGVDFGDAPNTYPTLFASGGPYHGVDPALSLYLGSCVDTEMDGQVASGTATDDDATVGTSTTGTCLGGDDEDGVVFDSLITACKSGDVTVTASAAGRLDAWIDFGGDGSFGEAGDQVFTSEPLVAGANSLSFTVPCSAAGGNTFTRFRFSTAGGLAPGGMAIDGEVEDYQIGADEADFGDAPDTYGTTFASGGALHGLDPALDLYLGACVDAEVDGQPTIPADGDDLGVGTSSLGSCAGNDDEDGVSFDTMVAVCQQADLTVTASAAGRLDAWIDLDGDGTFAGPNDQVFAGQALVAGPNAISFPVPCDATPGDTYARFRFSSGGGLGATGTTPNGEVEDYALVVKGSDFGDAPNPEYPTILANGGAQHVVDPASSVYLGVCADPEADGQPSANADGDDLGAAFGTTGTAGTCAGNDDENGVTFDTMLFACQTSQITVVAGAAGRLDAWIDFDRTAANGFGGAGDQIFASQTLVAGANVLNFDVPCNAQLGDTYARFRFSTTGGLAPGGVAMDGEVEDYPILVKGVDFGDAADTHSTTFASGGPTHGVDPAALLYLGACVDTEVDAQAPLDTTGDDLGSGTSTVGTCAVAGDDEDGVTFTSMVAGCETATIDVIASGAAVLDAWLDFTGDGTFTQAGERIFTGQALVAGANSLSFPVPCDADPGAAAVRFRLSSGGVPSFDGPAADGEVEDYESLVKGVDFGDAPDTYPTLFASGGPYHGVDPALDLYLGSCVDTEADGQVASGDATDDDATVGTSTTGTCLGGDDEDGVVFDSLITACKIADVTVTASAAGLLDAWVDFDGDGSFGEAGDQVFTSEPVVAGANSLSFMVPCSAAGGTTFTRFRFSTAGGLAPGGMAEDGEVEDYQIGADEADLGDAPDTYGTLFASGGALHGLDPAADLYLGACVDAEVDGQPTILADGDDLGAGTSSLGTCAGNDDEDGVSFDTMMVACQRADFTVTASAAGFLDAWIDLDRDGTFGGPDDQIFISEPLVAGANALSLQMICGVNPGNTYARFRFSSAGGLGATGTTPNGEVEDYAVLVKGADLGDAPDGYQTTVATGGPTHAVNPVGPIYLGGCVDTDTDGQPSVNADGDDLGFGTSAQGICAVAGDDEDGVTFDTAVNLCLTADITITASAPGFVDVWIDLDGDGTFAGPADQIFASEPVVAGATPLSFVVPCDATPGDSYVRVRYSSVGGLPSSGPALDGEVEDYPVLVQGFDLGDAPDPTYPTLIASDGARHIVRTTGNPVLGTTVDIEPEGLQSPNHTGDDLDGTDDEDGVTFTEPALIPGTTTQIEVTAGATGGNLTAWIDWNRDGDWTDAGEQITTDQAIAAGTTATLAVPVPVGAVDGASCGRFRFATETGLAPTGIAMDGEVEDYSVILGVEDPSIGVAKSLISVERLDTNQWQIYFEMTVDNAGNVPLSGVQVINDLADAFAAAEGYVVDFVMSTDFSVNLAFDGDTDMNLLDGTDILAVGESGMIEVQITLMPGTENGPYVCSAIANGTSPGDQVVSDVSQNGSNSDPDGNGNPGDNDEPTFILIEFPPIDIPTLGTWGFMALALMLAIAAMAVMRRRRLESVVR